MIDLGRSTVSPRPTFSLQPPKAASVSASDVGQRQTFTITGSRLYPSLVTGVLVGGHALPAANFQVVSDTKITVIVPPDPGFNLPVVVQTTQSVSNDNVTISIDEPGPWSAARQVQGRPE